MKRSVFTSMLLVLFTCTMLTGCYSIDHVVGKGGATTGEIDEVRQWYVLFGLVPINEVDTADMADGADDYTITTEFTALDVIIGIFTGIVSVYPRTVRVTK
ncbi:MAG: hypothetical protein HKN43_17430 [Rhodothermales bacterium]|nr:hypothetical protein [Rhodothermales bacterium]